jgi:hypothetical protein
MESIWRPDMQVGNGAALQLDDPTDEVLLDISTKDHQPRVISVMLSIDPATLPPYNLGNPDAELVARLQFGARDRPTIAEVDCLNGVILALTAAHLRVSARFRQVATPGVGPAWWANLRPRVGCRSAASRR